MMLKKFTRLVGVLLITVIFASVFNAAAAAISVPSLRIYERRMAITTNTLKPAACSLLTLTRVVICTGGNCDGTDENELILGSASADNIQGGKGDDCILGGDGNDNIRGEQGTDVCIGGPGTDSFHPSCETQTQ